MVAATIAILLTGPLLLFNPLFVRLEQRRHDVASALGVPWETVDRVTGELLGDLVTDGDFGARLTGGTFLGPLVLDASERMHMRDVGGLVRILVILDLVALVTLLLAGLRLRRGRERELRGQLLMTAAALVGGVAVLLGIVFAVAFDAAFTAFHGVFFAAGSWQFGPDSNLLRLFPEGFWYEAAIAAGIVIVASALLAAYIAHRHLRG